MEPVVHLRSAVAVLGRFPALAGADLDVGTGEIVLLRGPNGAGKTTLLRLCAGLVPLSSGVAVVLGVDLAANAAAVRRRVGLLGHATHLYDDLTVAENLDFWSRASGATPDDGRAALDRLEVAARLRSLPVHALSAGQRRRVSFAAMVARRPELWLLDEPHAGLDAAGRDTIDGLMNEAAVGRRHRDPGLPRAGPGRRRRHQDDRDRRWRGGVITASPITTTTVAAASSAPHRFGAGRRAGARDDARCGCSSRART